MGKLKRFLTTGWQLLILIGVLGGAAGLVLPPSLLGKNSPPSEEEDFSSQGDEEDSLTSQGEEEDDLTRQGDSSKADPCDHLPDPPGKAKGHDKKCPPLGSSSGIAKGDFNGDGIGDLAVGVPNEIVLDSNKVNRTAGAVDIIYGSATRLTAGGGTTGVPKSQIWHQNRPGVRDEPDDNDRFGAALAAGDFNGDNISDLAIGVPGEDFGQGAVQVLFGSEPNELTGDLGGLTADGNQEFFRDDLFPPVGGLTCCIAFGASLAWGKFNDDTIGDLAIGGTPFVLVLYGQKGVGLRSDDFDSKFFDKPSSALTAGKFNDDARDDLAVGIPLEDVVLPIGFGDSLDGAGVVRVFYGSSHGIDFQSTEEWTQSDLGAPDVVAPGAEPLDNFGSALAAGDFNCDSISDLAIGAPGEDLVNSVGNTLKDAGAVNVIYGSSSGLTATGNQFWHQGRPNVNIEEGLESGDNFGSALAAGNFDGFGCADLAIGVPFEDFGSVTNAGAVNVIYGQSDSGLTAGGIPAAQFFHQNTPGVQDEAGDRFGSTLTAWDFSGDGAADLAIGVPFEDVINNKDINTRDAGQVQVLYGSPRVTTCCPLSFSPGGLTTVNNQIWHQDVPGILGDVQTNDQFGSALY